MRKFLIIGIIILFILTVYNMLTLYSGIYISFDKDKNIKNDVTISENKIMYKGQEFKVKGVNVSSAYPGYNFSDYKVTKKKYLTWLDEISQMGANTIKAANRLNPEFYDALYEYNQNSNKKLYLLQSIELEEYYMNNSESIHGYEDEMLKECLTAVDVIHGNRYIVTSGIAGQGLYTSDVSEYTLGYIISKIGDDETIAFTDNTDVENENEEYDGKYFKTKEGSSETEKIIAKIMDKTIEYETKKYKEQKLISLTIEMLNDPLKYNESVNIQMGKMSYINLNNIIAKENLKSGKIVSYDLAYVVNDFIDMIDDEENEELKDLLNSINTNTIYDGYIDFISKFYNGLVLISNYGYSTSRMIDRADRKPITEKEQGEKIVEEYNKFIELGLTGAIITSWQDNWSHSTWNTTYSTEKDKEIYWHNKQSVNQSFGIVEFEQKDKNDICLVDGKIDEWKEENLISENQGKKIYAKYDIENLYLMIQNIKQEEIVYVPIDTTLKSGANKYENINLNRNADFLIRVNGIENSEILIQEYYDSIRAMYEEDITGEKQFVNKLEKNSEKFVPMRAMLKKEIDATVDVKDMKADERKIYKMYSTIDTGKLRHGINDPENENYDSLSDFMYGDNCVEIQIPLQLLNFSVPNEMLIHDDYYENFGVENKKIEEIFIGIGTNESETINLNTMPLKQWKKNVEVQERLKESYYIIRNAWGDK